MVSSRIRIFNLMVALLFIAGIIYFVRIVNDTSYTSIALTDLLPEDLEHHHGLFQRHNESLLTWEGSHVPEELNEHIKVPMNVIKFKDERFHHDDDTVANKLKDNVRVLCWVMTEPKSLETRAKHVKATWGKRCNILLFMSSETNTSFPTIGLNVMEGRDHLTGKTMQAFKYVYEHHYNDADWFMKTDDDTYVILENLRYFLSDKNTKEPVYYGHHFKVIVKQGYYSGGGGYVLSKEALSRFYHKGNASVCQEDGGAEDAEFGRCMEKLGVRTANSTDTLGRSRFHCFDPEAHVFANYPDWYKHNDANGAKEDFLSDYAISFHYIKPSLMYTMEYYIYHLRPFGIVSGSQQLNN